MSEKNRPVYSDNLRVALAQIAPVWLDFHRTREKIVTKIHETADQNCRLVVFGEAGVKRLPESAWRGGAQ